MKHSKNSNSKTSLKVIFIVFILSLININAFSNSQIKGIIKSKNTAEPIVKAVALIESTGTFKETNLSGSFLFENINQGTYTITFYAKDYKTTSQTITINENKTYELTIELENLEFELKTIEVKAQQNGNFSLTKLNNVDGFGIYAAKKSEKILLDNLVANLATNNARQVYKGIAGLNIWESDGAGLQLSIGARGLDPNRTSNFNTRQNGYDISADALGYPESYYTPPTQALERIEIVRGAASLQYGPQFGGLLNFVFKKGGDKPFEFVSENTVGSFGLLNTFNSIGGSKNGWNYYGFLQYKRGDGWRENSEFNQKTGYFSVSKSFKDVFKIGVEYTHTNYLAQQAGGLQDFEFQQNPRQSKRSRNWFQVNWNLAALTMDYHISERTKINNRSFFLSAGREALGELGPINRPDPMRERDLIRGTYTNFGNETRLIHRYSIANQPTTFLIGARYYQGYTTSQQGSADDGFEANFEFTNPTDLERSDYQFPSRNFSLFAENLFNFNKWTITPGLRLENIRTASEGYYKERVFSGGQVIFEQTFESAKENERTFLLAGLGVGYQLSKKIELYANFSQNYRSINFSDLAVVNPNLIVDSLLTDESGFNIDFGMRGTLLDGALQLDASLFFLSYQNRIGVGEIIVPDVSVVEKAVAFRTNIGDARILGLEAYGELDILKLINQPSSNFKATIFTNLSLLHGQYISGNSDFKNNDVELIPPFSIKTGFNFRYQDFKLSYQFAYTAQHFTDATNATLVVDATRGLIPSYHVQDISMSYDWKMFRFQTGVNNLTNSMYFTRRAAAYPGPGIIPSDGRNFYLGVRVTL
jgi:Fe(3+) dicitrate transport protein